MYRVDGSSELHEENLENFAGYKESRPVRIGNGASDQLQLDIYGELMDSVYLGTTRGFKVAHRGLDPPAGCRELALRALGPARRGDLGDPWRASSPLPMAGSCPGSRWIGRFVSPPNRVCPLDLPRLTAERDKIYTPDHGERLERQARRVCPALQHRRPRRLTADDAAGRLHRTAGSHVALDAARDGSGAGLG